MTANVFETCAYCGHHEHEHEHPHGCSRCPCDESYWGDEMCDAFHYWAAPNMGGARYCKEVGSHSVHRDSRGETWTS